MIDFEALFKVSYGLYIVCSGDEHKGNGYISNTVFQVTAEPPKFATCCNKDNFTAEFIRKHQAFSVSVLEQEASSEIIGKFGYKSGKDTDKLSGMHIKTGVTGVPIVLNESIACLEFKVVETVDVGTHWMFIAELISAELLDKEKEPLTYLHYRKVKKGFAPKNAPTYIDKSKLEPKPVGLQEKRYKCPACGYIYDESVEQKKFTELPEDWVCPVCGCDKADFIEI
jgi:flavin reductase (DIM6/NTAB) family NADH-FMN oxidoreductase RutF/rubredoxin